MRYTNAIYVFAIRLGILLVFSMLSSAQTWTPLAHQPAFQASTALLLTDGTVMVQALSSGTPTGQWWRLSPDNTGSYVNGTWSNLANMPSGYGPLYYASAVLPDGRVVVEGGEYNLGQVQVETTLGAVYNPGIDSWTSINPPLGWGNIGDAQSAVLSNGTFMLGNCCSSVQALLNASTLTWTTTGSGKMDSNSEEGWALLPSGKLLTVDVWNGTNSELYDPSLGSWLSAGSTVAQLINTGCSEVGPSVLRPDGTVFEIGGLSSTAIYNASSGTWSAGPTFTAGFGVSDGPAALLPSGNVLVQASPYPSAPCTSWPVGSRFYEFNGSTLTQVASTPNAPNDPSFVGRMLVLPKGQVLLTDGSASVQVYTPGGTFQNSWRPTVTSVSATLTTGTLNNIVSGTQFNGLSQGAMYGDDAQNATNYPLVRITNNASGHVFYCKTHDHSTMGVATGSTSVSTAFDVASSVETGASTLVVVANGIPSSPVNVTVAASPFVYTANLPTPSIFHTATLLSTGSVLVAGGQKDATYLLNSELYNPATGTFTTNGNLNTARAQHSATLLQNGLVLIAGGINVSGYLASAELFNPATGTFTPTGNLNTARDQFTATLLPSGFVLVAGGINGSGYLASAELFNPATGTFTPTGNLNTARDQFTATLLANGFVLVAGGLNGSGYLASAEIYNPATGTFTSTGTLNTPRFSHTATLLANGAVLVAGGFNSSSGYLASTELYNPATGTFTLSGSMNVQRYGHTATALQSGSVLVAGGFNSSSGYLASAELYNPAAGTFTTIGGMNVPRYGHSATLLQNGSVLIPGGFNQNTKHLFSAELYH